MKRTVLSVVTGVTTAFFLMFSYSFAEEETGKTDFLFWSRMTMGRVVASTLDIGYDIPFAGEWLEKIDGGLKVTRKLSPALTGRLNLGVVINAATVTPKGLTYEYATKKVGPVLLDATLQYRRSQLFRDGDDLNIELGYFPFKYNPQSTNLGEYLFRSGTYPGWLISGFEHSIDRPKLAGVHAAYTFGHDFKVKQNIIVNTELEVFPYRDINVTYLITQTYRRLIDFGLGVQFARLISVDPRKTTVGLDSMYKEKYDPKIGYREIVNGDTTIYRYTFRGTKLMSRATFDCKELFGGTLGIFGKEDLKLYGEAALLGVANYKGWYEKPRERVPAMLGFNLPMFGVLDVFSIEVERYQSPYANAQDYIWKAGSPVPYVAGRPGGAAFPVYDRDWNDSLAQTGDDIKWSIYASRRIGKHIRLSAQAACDHTPKNWYTPWPAPQSAKFSDMVPMSSDWYFMMRMSLYF